MKPFGIPLTYLLAATVLLSAGVFYVVTSGNAGVEVTPANEKERLFVECANSWKSIDFDKYQFPSYNLEKLKHIVYAYCVRILAWNYESWTDACRISRKFTGLNLSTCEGTNLSSRLEEKEQEVFNNSLYVPDDLFTCDDESLCYLLPEYPENFTDYPTFGYAVESGPRWFNKRTYCKYVFDLNLTNYPTEVVRDMETCFIQRPLAEKEDNRTKACKSTSYVSCSDCTTAIAYKYNNSQYCDLELQCGLMPVHVNRCKDLIDNPDKPPEIMVVSSYVNVSLIHKYLDPITKK